MVSRCSLGDGLETVAKRLRVIWGSTPKGGHGHSQATEKDTVAIFAKDLIIDI